LKYKKNLNDISFGHNSYRNKNESFKKSLEESLIKHADTIQYLKIDWNPITGILSHLKNSLSLEIKVPYDINWKIF
jgi:hypothetical protein